VPAPAHLFFHMHLLILGDTLTDGGRVITDLPPQLRRDMPYNILKLFF